MSDHEWHPLDGVPAPEYVPDRWTPEHVGLRLVEAFETLHITPVEFGPRGAKTAWPAYSYEPEDVEAQNEQAEAEEGAKVAHRVRMRATNEQVTRMLTALDWLWIAGDQTRWVVRWANARATAGDDPEFDHDFWSWAEGGLRVIADRLNATGKAVF